jgi:hypothetical protein
MELRSAVAFLRGSALPETGLAAERGKNDTRFEAIVQNEACCNLL